MYAEKDLLKIYFYLKKCKRQTSTRYATEVATQGWKSNSKLRNVKRPIGYY